MDLKYIIENLIEREHLTQEEATWTMNQIMEGVFSAAQMAAILTALRMKQETVTEITAFATVMREKATSIPVHEAVMIDTCGTGGDKSGTFNISTTVALLLASGGYKVAKHGNRSMTSKSGSADLLEALGVNLNLNPEQVADCIKTVGIGFLFAPMLHSAMKNVVPVRKELGVRTLFNILGPLTNPASANVQTMGLFSPKWVSKIIKVLKELGLRTAYVYAGLDGMDEVSITDNTQVAHLNSKGEIEEFVFDPEAYGFSKVSISTLKGGDPKENAEITRGILSGTLKGPKRDIVQVNAGFGISALEECSLEAGFKKAGELLDSGAGIALIDQLVKKTHSF